MKRSPTRWVRRNSLRSRPDNLLQFESRPVRRPRKYAGWLARNWPLGALLVAPIAGVGGTWAWYSAPSPSALFAAEKQDEQHYARFGRCLGPIRGTCVVDGDTFWLDGTKIRIADINTPEISEPKCAAELALGERATERLVMLLNDGGFSLETIDRDEDAYGRKLRMVTRAGDSLGQMLVAEGLAERWTGPRRNWC
jgi:micrococcal nuclease